MATGTSAAITVILLELFLHLYTCFSVFPVTMVLEGEVSPASENPLSDFRGSGNLLKRLFIKFTKG